MLPKSVFNCHTWKRLLTIKSLKTSLIMYIQQELFPYFSLFIHLFISTPKSNTTISAIVLTSDISHKIKFFLTWAFRLHSQVSRPNNKPFTIFMVLSSNSFCPHCKTVVFTVNLFCNDHAHYPCSRLFLIMPCYKNKAIKKFYKVHQSRVKDFEKVTWGKKMKNEQ